MKWAKQQAAHQQVNEMTWQKALAECGSYGEWITPLLLTIIIQTYLTPSHASPCVEGDPPSFTRFYIQLAEFSVAVVVGRVICGSLVRHHGCNCCAACTCMNLKRTLATRLLLLLLLLLLSVSVLSLVLLVAVPEPSLC